MTPTVTLEAQLNRSLGRFVKELGIETAKAVREQARGFIRDLIGGTPPFGAHPFTRNTTGNTPGESYNVQRRIGERAVRRDLRRVFRKISVLARWLARKFNKPGLERQILRYGRFSDTAAIQTILDRMNIRAKVRTLAARPDHLSRRNRRGRVSPRGIRYFITDERTVDDYEREEVSHVGSAKGGWASAAAALNVPIPGWIRGNAGPGLADVSKLNDTRKPSVTIGNLVAHAEQAAAEDPGLMRAVIENRIRAMRLRVEAIVKAQYEKEKRRGR